MSANTKALIDMLNKKKQEMDKGNNFRPFKVQNGDTIVRVLPSWREEVEGEFQPFWHDFGLHYIKAMEDGKPKIQAVYACPDRSYGKECDVCAAMWKAKNYAEDLGDEAMAEMVSDAYAAQQYLVNVLILSHSDSAQRSIPTTMTVGKKTFEQITGIMETYAQSGINILDIEEGVDLVINRSGAGRNTTYQVNAHPKGQRAAGKINGEIPNLDDIVEAEFSKNNESKATMGLAKASGLPMPASGSEPAPGLSAPAKTPSLVEEAAEGEFTEVAQPDDVAKAAAEEPEVSSDDAAADAELEDMLKDFDL